MDIEGLQQRLRTFSFTEGLSQLQLVSLDACVRCGICLEWCPELAVTGEVDYSTPEKLRLYSELVQSQHSLAARLLGRGAVDIGKLERLAKALYACTTCGVCGEVCPVGIDTMRLWPALRAKMVELGVGPWGGQSLLPGIVQEKHNPYDRPHADRFSWLPKDIRVAKAAEVGFFAGCSGCYTAIPMMVGAVRLFQATSTEFTLLEDEWCCGFPLSIVGEMALVEELIRHNVEGFRARGVKRLMVSCPCCSNMIANQWRDLYGELPFELVHITQFLCEQLDAGKLAFSKPYPERVTYHDPCYLSRGIRLTEEPRRIIRQFPAAEFVEM